MAAERIRGIELEWLEPSNFPETLTLLYMQGVAEALDVVSLEEVIRALEEGTDSSDGSIEA